MSSVDVATELSFQMSHPLNKPKPSNVSQAKLAVVLEKVPEGWDAIRLGYWGKTRAMDAVNDAVYRVGTWWENGDSM